MAAGVRDWRTGRMRADKAFWAVCKLLGVLLFWFGLTKLSDAHVPGHDEWNDVLSASKSGGEQPSVPRPPTARMRPWRSLHAASLPLECRRSSKCGVS